MVSAGAGAGAGSWPLLAFARAPCRRREGELMRQWIVHFGSAALFALGIALAGASAANAESIMKTWAPRPVSANSNGESPLSIISYAVHV